jgi:S1-C subfamily serine protease
LTPATERQKLRTMVKHPFFSIGFSFLVFFASLVSCLSEDIVTKNGVTYKNIKIASETTEAVKIMHSGGIAIIPKTQLSQDFLTLHELSAPANTGQADESNKLTDALKQFKVTTPSFSTRDGRQFRSADIQAIDPSGIKVVGTSGIVRLAFLELPESVRKALGYDADLAEKFSQQAAKQAEESAVLRTKIAEAASTAEMFVRHVRLILRQNFDKGWVCNAEVTRDGQEVVADLGKVMVFGLPSYASMHQDLQGTRVWSGNIYRIGNYVLHSASNEGTTKTDAYHLDKSTAIKLMAAHGNAVYYGSNGLPDKTSSPKSVATESIGTAFAITADGFLGTAAHVIEGARSIEVTINGEVRLARTIITNQEMDIAIIKVDGVQLTPLRMKPLKTVQPGAGLFAVGFPLIETLGKNAKLTTGSLNSHTGMQDDPNTFQMSVQIQPGNSGGPVCDKEGNVVGIVSKTVSTLKGAVYANGAVPQNVNFATKADLLISVSNDVKIQLPNTFPGKGTAEERVMASSLLVTVKL